jgi:gas vesicle protein
MKLRNLTSGIIVGVAIGAVAGVLFAPYRGSKTRQILFNKGEDYVKDLKDKLNDLASTISDKYMGVSEDAQNIIADGSEKIEEVTNDYKQDFN